MRSSIDRVAELFGTDEVRSLLATSLPGYESYAFSELVRAARDRLANTPAHSVGILARELRRAGLARVCQKSGVTGVVESYWCAAERRPSKVMSKAFRAVFQRMVQRA
ncbi:hypothetical protein, partial [Streptomyces salyersiae]